MDALAIKVSYLSFDLSHLLEFVFAIARQIDNQLNQDLQF
jgi:hypothetical protein